MDNQTKGPKAANEIDKHIIGPIMTYNADRLAETTSAYLAARAKLDNPNNKDRLGALKVLCRAEEKMKDALAAYRSAQSGEVEGDEEFLLKMVGKQKAAMRKDGDSLHVFDYQLGFIDARNHYRRNTPPQSVGHDELVGRLKLMVDNRDEFDKNVIWDAITALSHPISPWVKIEDIPDEWKDGRTVLLSGGRLLGEIHIDADNDEFISATFNNNSWHQTHGDAYEVMVIEPTRAMLPIAPAKTEG